MSQESDAAASPKGPYVEMTRAAWAALAAVSAVGLDAPTLERLRGLEDPTSLGDVEQVYLPLTQLMELYRGHRIQLLDASNAYLGLSTKRTPFIIGVAGSVAVGKSTTARLLRELLSQGPGSPKVDLVTTDGFLLPNAEHERRGIAHRKGFPESYDRRALLAFVMDVKSGRRRVKAPVYSHMIYDIVPDQMITVDRPDIMIIEGLNVLQPARRRMDGTQGLAVSDFFDFSVYVDAETSDIRRWFFERMRALRDTAFQDPDSFFRQYAEMTDDELTAFADSVWDDINGPNLALNIVPTRERATVILRKDHDHTVEWVRIRKV